MATQSIQGLFGGMGSPEEMQRAALEQKAMQFAQLTQDQQLGAMGYKGGANLGRGLASAFGVDVQDPSMKQASMLRQLASQFDTGTVDGMKQYAAALQGVNPEMANRAMNMAREMELSEAKLSSEKALTTQREREKDAADPFQKLLEKGVYTPASLALYKTSKNVSDLKYKDKEFSPSEIQTLQEYRKTLISPAQDKEIAEVNAVIKAAGEGKAIKVTATASTKGADEGSKTIAELGAKRVDAANVSAGKAIEQAGLLRELLKTPQPIAGSGAPVRVGALRVFSTFGLTSAKDDEALGNADKFNALAGERVISFIKALGSQPTDTDREFARSIGPALEKGTKTNTDLINFLLERSRKVVKDANAMETHFYDNNYSLRGYKSPFITDLEAPKSKASELTTEQLLEIAKRLKPS
jgi:hypothetical protein